MNFKKITSSALSLALVVTSLGVYSPSYAEKADKNEYFDKVKSVSTWQKVDSKSNTDVQSDLTIEGQKTSFGYDIDINSKSDIEKFISVMDIKFTPKTKESPAIPNIKLFVDDKSFYINKDAFNSLALYMGIDKSFTKDYVKIDYSNLDSSLNANYIKNISTNSSQVTEKAINFIKGIDLGIDLGLSKESDGAYTLSWDSDKIVNVTNAYFKYMFSNFEVLEKFYSEVLGVDLYAMYKEMGADINKEDMQKSMKTTYDMWTTNVEPMLPKVKEIIKGSSFKMEEKFATDNYSSKVTLNVAVDMNKSQELLEKISPIPVAETDKEETANTAKKEKNEFKLSLVSNQNSSKLSSIDLTLPSSYDTFDYKAYVEEQQKKWEEELKNSPKSVEQLEYAITPSKKTLKTNYFGDISESAINIQVKNGSIYVAKADMEKILEREIESGDAYIPFKATMEKDGFTVVWDKENATAIATYNF